MVRASFDAKRLRTTTEKHRAILSRQVKNSKGQNHTTPKHNAKGRGKFQRGERQVEWRAASDE
ncbi:MAG: hypothetical protein LBT09_14805 [Planctomycetaceae bacterium]|nr:hypothetical protein [Planctomycetaceae bacterium]